MRKWSLYSKLYLIFTSYKLLNNGESCTGENSGMASPVQMRSGMAIPVQVRTVGTEGPVQLRTVVQTVLFR